MPLPRKLSPTNKQVHPLGILEWTPDTSFKALLEISEVCYINLLPPEVQHRILHHLSAGDLSRLRQASKHGISELAESTAIWKELFYQNWIVVDAYPNEGVEVINDTEESYPPRCVISNETGQALILSSQVAEDEANHVHWKEIYRATWEREQWQKGILKMFNGCWGFISIDQATSDSDIFFHRKDIEPKGQYMDEWWIQDTGSVSRSQKCSYWDNFLCGRRVRYRQRSAYAAGKRPQACSVSFILTGDANQ